MLKTSTVDKHSVDEPGLELVLDNVTRPPDCLGPAQDTLASEAVPRILTAVYMLLMLVLSTTLTYFLRSFYREMIFVCLPCNVIPNFPCLLYLNPQLHPYPPRLSMLDSFPSYFPRLFLTVSIFCRTRCQYLRKQKLKAPGFQASHGLSI
jgi:hypothetical protein